MSKIFVGQVGAIILIIFQFESSLLARNLNLPIKMQSRIEDVITPGVKARKTSIVVNLTLACFFD